MARVITDAVQILRFFETEPIERAEIVFDIVTDKMRERLGGRRAETNAPGKEPGAARRRRDQSGGHVPTAGGSSPQEVPS
jgi:hypothetical protein